MISRNLCSAKINIKIEIINNISEIGIPYIIGLFQRRRKANFFLQKLENSLEDKEKLILRIEKNVYKSAYGIDDLDGTYYDNHEVLIQMGYITFWNGLSTMHYPCSDK